MAKSSACLRQLYHKVHLRRHVLAHRAVIYWLKFDRRSELIITASDDYTVKLWSLQSINGLEVPFLRHTLRGHAAEIVGVDLSIDNHLLASADADCSLVIWCLRTGQQLVSFRGCRNNRAISGLQFIPFLPKTRRHSSLSGCSGWLLVATYSGGLHFIPYKHQTIGGNPAPSCGFVDCCVLRLNPTLTIDNLEASVLSFDISPGAHFIAVGCSDNFVRMYTFADNGLPGAAGRLFAREDGVNKLKFSNSGAMLATASSNGGTCWLWKLQSGLWTGAELKLRKRPRCRPCLLQWTKDDRYLLVSTKSGSVYVFLGRTGEVANVLRGHEGAVYAVAVSPFDEEIIATGGVDGRFYIWHLTAHRTASRRPPGEAEDASPVLAFYRYPRPQMETDLGIAWPLPQYDNNQEPLPQALGTYAPGGDESGEQAAATAAPRNGTSLLITAEGPAFLVATKAGVISLFAFSGCREGATTTTAEEETVIPYEEQFLHWEMDAAELQEVSSSPEDPQQSAAVAIALGSPPCQQSISNSRRTPYGNRAYRPPPGVLFQLVHAPSQVPFSRLPPAYLTTLKGCVYPLERQRQQICGRRHLSLPLDLQPTLAFDEDGEEVVVDDIQFCGCVPNSYCYPPPRQTVVQGVAGKNYLWRCHWLCDGNSMVAPLSSSELDLAYRRLTELNQLERERFQAPAAVPAATTTLPIECDASTSVGPSTSNCLGAPIDFGSLSSSSAPQTLPSHEDAVPTLVPHPDVPTSPFMNNSTTTTAAELPHSDAEYAPSDSEESEWSAHIDAEIGWWQRRRRRRPRRTGGEARTTTTNGPQRTALETSAPPEDVVLVSEVVPTHAPVSQNTNTAAGTVSSLSGALRRSARQRRRILAQTRAEREQSRVASRTSQLEAARQLRRARRSERDDSTSRDALIDHRGRNREQSPLISISPSKSREVMKQQLIHSIDYTSMNRVKLPLEHPPPLGYSAPLTCCEPTTLGDGPAWPGPNIDWLSVTVPAASPYVPQLGDRVVYIVRGHKEYLEKAWQGGRVPPLDRSHQSMPSFDNSPLNSVDLELPWEENPSLPGYICCRVEELAFHFMRINSGGQPSHRGGGDRSRRHHPLNSGVRRRRPVASSSNRLRRSPFCTLGDTNQEPGPSSESASTTLLAVDVPEQPADSFVRLATLRLAVEASQPYIGIGSQGNTTALPTALPRELLIRYHDVDGVLDFIVLRSLFNESLSRSWNTGEVFVCPVDDVWWRGRVLSPFPALLSTPHQSTSVSVTWSQPSPPTDQSSADSLPLLLSPRDPWLGVRVRWLENEECGSAQEPLLPPSLWAAAAAATAGRAGTSRGFGGSGSGSGGGGASFDLESLSQGRGRFRGDPHADTRVLLPDRSPGKPMLLPTDAQSEPDVVLTFSDYLSPWDMHVWTSRLPVSDSPIPSTSNAVATTSASVSFLRSSEVRLPSARLTELFGSGCDLVDHSSSLLRLVRRMEHFMDKIMSLGASEAFINPVDLAAYPNYVLVNPYLVDLLFIRQRLHNLFYREVNAIRFDIEQVHANAVRYNEPNSLIVRQAQLITTLAVRALDDPSYTEETMLAEYTAAVRQEHALDPSLQVLPSSPVTTSPATTSMANPSVPSICSDQSSPTTTTLPGRSARQHPTSSRVSPPSSPLPSRLLKRTRHGTISDTNHTSALTPGTRRISATPIKRLHLEDEEEQSQENDTAADAVDDAAAVAAPTTHHVGYSSSEDIHSRLRRPPAVLSSPPQESSPGSLDWHQTCCTLLAELRRSRRSIFFRRPVDITQYPTYALSVQVPMDLSTIKRRLESTSVVGSSIASPRRSSSAERQSAVSCYTSARDFLDDLNLIVSNSRSFNRRPDTQVYADTRWLSKWIRRVAQQRLRPFLASAAAAPPGTGETILLLSSSQRSARCRSSSGTSVAAPSRTAAAAGAGAGRLRVQPLRLRRSPETARLHFCAQKVKRGRQRQRQLSSRLASYSLLPRLRRQVAYAWPVSSQHCRERLMPLIIDDRPLRTRLFILRVRCRLTSPP
ncbi:hypothetical protein AAHC03_020574 [Spirometra sp. Aus1]